MADISNYDKIYGPSIASLKGNQTSSKPSQVIKDDIQISSDIYENNSNIGL